MILLPFTSVFKTENIVINNKLFINIKYENCCTHKNIFLFYYLLRNLQSIDIFVQWVGLI